MTLPTSQQLRENPRLLKILDEITFGKDFDVANKTWHTPERVNTYLLDRLEGYEWTSYVNAGLLWGFKQDFEGWTEELFDLADRNIHSTLRTYLKNHRILIGTEGIKVKNFKLLFALLQEEEYRKWPSEEV